MNGLPPGWMVWAALALLLWLWWHGGARLPP